MPWGVAASVGGALVSSALAPSAGSTSAGPAYTPYNQPALDSAFNNYYGAYGDTLTNYMYATSPLATGLLNNQFNNPYAGNYTQGAQQAQNAYYGAGAQANTAGANNFALAQQAQQNATNWGLNGSELGLLQSQAGDTANAQSYLRGIQGSPYGAAVATNAIDQTNLNYALNQAQTQQNYASLASSLYGAGTQQYGAGAGYYGTGSSLPFQAQSQVYGGQNQALQNYYGTIGNYLQGQNQLQSNALSYLGYGTTAQNTAANQAYNNYGLQQQQASGITQGLAQAANGFSGGQSLPQYFGYGSGSQDYGVPGWTPAG